MFKMIKKIITKPISPDNIYISGDINCQSYRLMMKIDLRSIKDSHIIILGNFGIGTLSRSIEDKNLTIINKKLKEKNNKIYLLLGDKDNGTLFDKYSKKYKNIVFTKELEVLKINDIKFMFIGGSVNLNRSYQFNPEKREKPTMFREIDIPHNTKVDVVLSHDNVDFVEPYNLYNLKPFTKTDKWLYNDIKKKRKKLSSIYTTLKDTRKCNLFSWYSSKYDNDIIEVKNKTNFIQLKQLDIVKLTL